MKINAKSILYTIIIVGAFVFLCFRADLVPGIGSYLGGDLYGEQSTLNPDGDPDILGPIAQSHYDSFMLTLWITALLCITVGGPFVYAMFAFKEKPGFDPKKDKLPKQTHGNTKIEVSLIFYSTALLFIIAFLPFGEKKIPAIAGIPYFFEGKTKTEGVPTLPDDPLLTINVTGHQWWFSFHYPDHGIVTSNEFVFPTKTAVKINLDSNDVIHSFWLAKLAGKLDLMPGQTNQMWIYADYESNYSGQCAEFCGDSHAYMLFRGIATSQEKFDKWVENQKQKVKIEKVENEEIIVEATLSYGDSEKRKLDAKETLGYRLFEGNAVPELLKETGQTANTIACKQCHSLDALPPPNWDKPNLHHFAERTTIAAGWRNMNPERIKEWIQQPGKVKPGNRMWRDFAVKYGVIEDKNVISPDGEILRKRTTQDLYNRKQTKANAHYKFFTDEEAEAIAAFLLTLKHPEAPDLGAPPLGKYKRKAAPDKKQATKNSTKSKLAQN